MSTRPPHVPHQSPRGRQPGAAGTVPGQVLAGAKERTLLLGEPRPRVLDVHLEPSLRLRLGLPEPDHDVGAAAERFRRGVRPQ